MRVCATKTECACWRSYISTGEEVTEKDNKGTPEGGCEQEIVKYGGAVLGACTGDGVPVRVSSREGKVGNVGLC